MPGSVVLGGMSLMLNVQKFKLHGVEGTGVKCPWVEM